MRGLSAVWVAIAVTIGACGGGQAATTTTTAASPALLPSPLVLSESGAPPGIEFVASLSWQQLRPGLDELLAGGVVTELESLGLSDGSASVFLSPGSGDAGLVDLAAGGRLAISAALAFEDSANAERALEVIGEAVMAYAGELDATTRPFDVGGVAVGAVGLVVNDPVFPGGAAAVAWVEGAVVRISFAQGGDPTLDARAVASAMTEMQ